MGAALTLLLILTISITFTRMASVALRLTGVPDHVARFQARSAFTGCGFTTSESESVVTHPIRRRVLSVLMLLGNLGFVTVLATVIVSFTSASGSMAAMSTQLIWLAGAAILLWLVALNPVADRLMCQSLGWILRRTTTLGDPTPMTLLQLGGDYGIVEHTVPEEGGRELAVGELPDDSAKVLCVIRRDGRLEDDPGPDMRLAAGDRLITCGSDAQHASIHDAVHEPANE